MSQRQTEEYRLRDLEMVAMRIEGKSYPEIGKAFGITDVCVRRVVKRALKRGELTLEQMRVSERFGTPSRPPMPKALYDIQWMNRVKSRLSIDQYGCWLWQGTKATKGYGLTVYRLRSITVHRMMYMIVNGVDLATEQFVLHRCDVPACCNPDHLFLGDNDINMADKCAKGRHHEMKVTHCPRGHAYDGENLRINPNGSRACKSCQRGRLRIKAGWSEEMAFNAAKVPPGYSLLEGRMP